jgi:histidinol-phosphatase (PHP family)
MPITADYHLHSSFSNDSDTPMESMIQQGIAIGLTHMCFTEHNDFDFPDTLGKPPEMGDLDVNPYLQDFLHYREIYKDQIQLRFGVEMGLQPQVAERNMKLARSYDFDFIIGSSHAFHGFNPYYSLCFDALGESAVYEGYFQSIWENLQVYDDFDVYGHLDYVVRYGPNQDTFYHYLDHQDIFELILKHLITHGKGLEVNTGGVKSGLKELHPLPAILKRYKELGGEIITIGSDAHTPDRLGEHFPRAEELLLELGFQYYTIFEKRKPIFLPLS